jgi:hypothetical protein
LHLHASLPKRLVGHDHALVCPGRVPRSRRLAVERPTRSGTVVATVAEAVAAHAQKRRGPTTK